MSVTELQWGRTFSSAEVHDYSGFHTAHILASMGPHFFKCGSIVREIIHLSIMVASMGPHFFKCGSAAKTESPSTDRSELQWGRTFSSAEVRTNTSATSASAWLQWGRTFSSAEVGRCTDALSYKEGASMGPHFFKCGSIGTNFGVVSRVHRFNGAALFQVRKSIDTYVRSL